jgi:predicted HicB family RNase H-like nuclease
MKKQLHIMLDPDIHHNIKQAALNRNITITTLVLRAITQYLAKEAKYKETK